MAQFLDEAVVKLESGRGGRGSASFHREKHVPRGGPNGGDGGRGGDVILVADRHKRTLYDFHLKTAYKADNGSDAVASKNGRNGESVRLAVPVGTVVWDQETGEKLVDLVAEGTEYIICQGGKGGLGNLHFTNSIRQAPHFAQKGAPSDRVVARLELKLLADVGLIGLPNAGKSTLLSAMSSAKPKIGAYPFTTITPNLGVVSAGEKTYVMGDLPGLIEGASEGVGLGHQFLRHAERNTVLLHVVDSFPIDESDPVENFLTVERELAAYSPELVERPRLVALNKSDLTPDPEYLHGLRKKIEAQGFEVMVVSGATSAGLEELKFRLLQLIEEHTPEAVVPTITPTFRRNQDDSWSVERQEDGTFVVTGKRIERLVAMTDLENRDALYYLVRRLRRIGVLQALQEAGIDEGDTVVAGEMEFTFTDWS